MCAIHLWFVAGPELTRAAWENGKGMIQPLLIVFVVLGSIYGGITGITEAAAMGSIAVLFLICLRGEFSLNLLTEASMRTFKSTGTIIWVTFGATALAGAYTIAGGPTYVANLIIGYDLPTMGVLAVMMIIFLFLGAFMDWTGIVLLVMPVFPADRIETAHERTWPDWKSGNRYDGPRLVRHIILRQYAGKLPLTTIWSGCILSEIGSTAAHHTAGYFQRLPALHRPANFSS